MANTHLQKTFSASANRERQTISVWLKRTGVLGTTQAIFSVYGNESYYAHLRFKSDDSIQLYNNSDINIRTNRKFRDVNAWYHIHVIIDTPNSTSTDRIRLYVNGERETDLANTVYPAVNGEIKFGDSNLHSIGSYDSGSYFDGCMSHFHFITNNAYEPTVFGSTDSTTGEWKINTNPNVTYGTNGFFVLKDGNSGTDESGNSNNFTVAGGTLTNTEDNPSNVFATLNAINNYYPNNTLSNGNTSFTQPASTYASTGTTLGMTSGKWYAEVKCTYVDNWGMVGIFGTQPTASGDDIGKEIDGYAYFGGSSAGGSFQKRNNNTNTSYDTTFTTNDIISIAVDLDNYKIYFGKNGTWLNSGDPTSGATGTGAAFTISQTPSSGAYFFAAGNWDGDNGFNASWNFGNGYFGTTAVSSAGTNASGNGIFEYDVPTGYTALSTKGLNL